VFRIDRTKEEERAVPSERPGGSAKAIFDQAAEITSPEQRTCGACGIDPRRGEPSALLKVESGVQEVFALALPPRRFPDLVYGEEQLLESSFVVSTEYLGEVAATVRASGPG
jgi:hypothetical protein